MIRLIVAAVLLLGAIPAGAADKGEKAWKAYVQEVDGGPWEYHAGLSGNDRCFVINSAATVGCNPGLAGIPFAMKVIGSVTGESYVYKCERMNKLTDRELLDVEPKACFF